MKCTQLEQTLGRRGNPMPGTLCDPAWLFRKAKNTRDFSKGAVACSDCPSFSLRICEGDVPLSDASLMGMGVPVGAAQMVSLSLKTSASVLEHRPWKTLLEFLDILQKIDEKRSLYVIRDETK
jgi:hypothetical protein